MVPYHCVYDIIYILYYIILYGSTVLFYLFYVVLLFNYYLYVIVMVLMDDVSVVIRYVFAKTLSGVRDLQPLDE
jgi:hypothetical protein